MDAVSTLMDEHRVIEKVIDALEQYVARLRGSGAEGEKAELLRFVEFIQKFADRYHHGKEEDILFAEMIAAGFPSDSGPLGVMLHEHDQGRSFVGELKQLGEQAEPWTDEDRERLARAGNGYIGLLRDHIQKEDNVLYPMAQSRLSAEVMADIGQRFEIFARSKTAAGENERLRRLAEEMVARHC